MEYVRRKVIPKELVFSTDENYSSKGKLLQRCQPYYITVNPEKEDAH